MNIHKVILKYNNSSTTFKATVWYAICNIAQKLSAFLLIPFLTRMLDTEDYGIYTVFLSWMELFEIFATMRMYSNGYMAGAVRNESDQGRYTCSIQFLSIIINTVALLAYHVFSPYISALVQIESKYLYLMFMSYYATSSIGIWTARQRVNNKYKSMTCVTLCYGVLAPVCSIIAAVISADKLNAAITVRIVVQCLVATPFLLKNLFASSNKVVWSYCEEALKYNIPLIPYYLSMVVLNSSDRIMIQRIVGEREAAIYGVAYSLSMAIFVFSGAINMAIQPWMFKEIKTGENKDRTKTFNIGLTFITILNLMVLIVAPELMVIVASIDYYDAIWAMPPIVSSLIIMFIYQQFLNVHFFFGKNKITFGASIMAATLNAALNLVCINLFGYIAAGYTTLVSYIVIAILYYFTMKKICADNDVEYGNYFSLKFITIDVCIYAVLTIVISFLYPYPIIRYVFVLLVLAICFIRREKIIPLCKGSGLI